jgi:ribosomal protein S12 methylthiotransferase
MKKIGLVSLGCAKNLVDSEMMLAMFRGGDYVLTSDPAEADLIIVNTCGFIEDARLEGARTIHEMGAYHGKLVAVGCYVEKDLERMREEFPEVDLFVPIREYRTLHKKIGELLSDDSLSPLDPLKREVSTPSYTAYLRISEGCDNFCSFCAIPYIRGRMVSRPFDEIITEARMLKDEGRKELVLVSQDPMHYGADFPSKKPDMLDLMKALDGMGFYSIRLLYLYPEEITDEELLFIKSSKSIAHYFDVPIQSASDPVLKRMNRHCTVTEMRDLFKRIRELMPEASLRTTLIAGFPGETEEDHKATLSFIEEIGFDHLGAFSYSREEGTAAYSLKGQVSEKTKERRRNELMLAARGCSLRKSRERVGSIMEGIVTGYDVRRGMYSLRSFWNAPDGIDGDIYFKSDKPFKPGDITRVRITSGLVYDLIGELA